MTACIDYDNTIVDWDEKFLTGAKEAIRHFKEKGWTVFICSGRYDLAEISKKLTRNDVPFDEIYHKPRSDVFIDDRAIRFTNWASVKGGAIALAEQSKKTSEWIKEQKENRYKVKDEKEIEPE